MHGLSVAVLSSGSCGNSILVADNATRILIDVGISCREMERRLSFFGAEPSQIDAVVLTHEHTDHVRGLRRFCQEHQIAVHGTVGTLSLSPTGGLDVSAFRPGERLRIGDLEVKSFHVNHFAADPVAFSIMSGSRRVSVASDLGCVIPSVVREMKGADLLMLEANYDDKMLTTGSYPEFLKEAIRSDHGHLSNQDAGSLVANAVSANTEGVVLIHLSKENNTPARARATVDRRFAAGKPRPWLEVAQHGKMLGPISLR